jgi:galactokinase
MDIERLRDRFIALFGRSAEHLVSAPGRIEIGGNHTDHQGGRVLAAAIHWKTAAAVAANNLGSICVVSEGLDEHILIELSDLTRRDAPGDAAELVRGMAAGLRDEGYDIEGFDAYVTSEVPIGAGLSSSAAFELVIGTAMSHLFAKAAVPPETLARIAQRAEREFFGKPCGLMDQLTSAVGGLVMIDFENEGSPRVERLDASLDDAYDLLVVDTGSNHADLAAEYAVIPAEMKAVAQALGHARSREIDKTRLLQEVPRLRASFGDRAILRTLHFLSENERVDGQVEALRENDFPRFLELVQASGDSSWKWLQNIFPPGSTRHQSLALALAVATSLRQGPGASRVLGGGFAGAIEVFLRKEETPTFRSHMEEVFGSGCVLAVEISSQGAGALV